MGPLPCVEENSHPFNYPGLAGPHCHRKNKQKPACHESIRLSPQKNRPEAVFKNVQTCY